MCVRVWVLPASCDRCELAVHVLPNLWDRVRAVVMPQREKIEAIQPADIKECTFQPDIGNTDDVLIQTRPARLGETEEQRYLRLSKTDSEDVERVRAAISESYYAQFTFRPEINELSKVRAWRASVRPRIVCTASSG